MKIGEQYGCQVVIELGGYVLVGTDVKRWKAVRVRCVDCSNEKTVPEYQLRNGYHASCRCNISRSQKEIAKRHGHAINKKHSPTYSSWANMKSRCLDPDRANWIDYGGRGITVCERWMKFENFLADMGERPNGTTIERIDVNGNYELSNCRWATLKEQAANKRKS